MANTHGKDNEKMRKARMMTSKEIRQPGPGGMTIVGA